jgi:putative tryptophan/tyrosine transport system substrate-binding protein
MARHGGVMNNRRKLIAALGAGALMAPLAALAQQQRRVWRIGVLMNGNAASSKGQIDAFVRGLSELGYTDGKSVSLEICYADGNLDRLPGLVAELLAQKVDIFFAPSGVTAQAAQQSGTTIPIVFAIAPNPVGQGFAQSLAHPGGNMTGLTSTHGDLSAKRLELLKEAFPTTKRVAVLYYVVPSGAGVAEQLAETERAAKVLGVSLLMEGFRQPEDFERVFASPQKQRPDALVVMENPMFYLYRVRLTELAATSRIPAIYAVSDYADAGGLMSYGASYADLIRRAATTVVKILNGAKPGSLPIEQPTKFELAINMQAAKALGIKLPAAVLGRADKILE